MCPFRIWTSPTTRRTENYFSVHFVKRLNLYETSLTYNLYIPNWFVLYVTYKFPATGGVKRADNWIWPSNKTVAVLYPYGPKFRLTEVWCGCTAINCLTQYELLQVLTGLSSTKDFTPCYEIPRYEGKGKGKAIPLQVSTDPEGSRRLRFPDFKTNGTWRW